MKRDWNFLQNPFLSATEGSHRKAYRISLFHDSALNASKTDPAILPLYNSFHPLHVALTTAYNTWNTQGGTQQGNTLTLDQLLKQLSSTKIRTWDVAIQNVYPLGTTQYLTLLPHRRTPFQKGTQTDRLATLKSLGTALTGITALASTKTDVDNFYTSLNTAIANSQGGQSITKNSSTAVETARVNMCIGQYANLGSLIQKFASNPTAAALYFDLKAIRNGQQATFTGHLKGGQKQLVVKRKFKATDRLFLLNDGTTDLQFYLAASKNAPVPAHTVLLHAGGETEILVSDLGDITTSSFLFVQNLALATGGDYEVDLE